MKFSFVFLSQKKQSAFIELFCFLCRTGCIIGTLPIDYECVQFIVYISDLWKHPKQLHLYIDQIVMYIPFNLVTDHCMKLMRMWKIIGNSIMPLLLFHKEILSCVPRKRLYTPFDYKPSVVWTIPCKNTKYSENSVKVPFSL